MKLRKKEKKAKTKEIPVRVARQIELLQKYYDIDIENRIIYLELHYDRVSDVLANDVSFKDLPQFSNDVIERVAKLVQTFPTDFEVDLKLKFNDYEGYDPEILLSSFQDNLEMFHYSFYKEKKYTWLIAAILIVISSSLIGFRLFAINGKLLSDSGILQEMIDITGWVFLWEAVSLLFLTESEKREISKKVIAHLTNISLLDSNNTVLANVNHTELTSTWVFETRKQRAGRTLLLICGAACLAFGIIKFFNGITGIIELAGLPAEADKSLTCLTIGINFLYTAIFVLAGIGSLNIFREKGPLQKFVGVIAWILFIYDMFVLTLVIVLLIIMGIRDAQVIFSSIASVLLSSVISVAFFVGYQITRRNKRVIKLKTNKKTTFID